MNWFKKEEVMIKTKIGLISRSTLKNNQDMIKKAYRALITENDYNTTYILTEVIKAIEKECIKRYGDMDMDYCDRIHSEKSIKLTKELISLVKKIPGNNIEKLNDIKAEMRLYLK